MFETAIEKIAAFTRPLKTITRTYNGIIQPGSSTFFFINENGVAVTCKHVAAMINDAEIINQKYRQFCAEKNNIPANEMQEYALKSLEEKHGYTSETTVQMKHQFSECFDKISSITCHMHPSLDLAVVEFRGFETKFYSSHAIFTKDEISIKQGKYLCRYGYPFPEFTNFGYNSLTDDIEFTNTGIKNCPSFPIDGIITRFVNNETGKVFGIEMSTPGLRGQSGGPLFDIEGRVYGMQFATTHLHLGFDIENMQIISGGNKSVISNHPFFHAGVCIHIRAIKEFLQTLNIPFAEE